MYNSYHVIAEVKPPSLVEIPLHVGHKKLIIHLFFFNMFTPPKHKYEYCLHSKFTSSGKKLD